MIDEKLSAMSKGERIFFFVLLLAFLVSFVLAVACGLSTAQDHMINPNQQINMLLDARCINGPGKVHVELFDAKNILSKDMSAASVSIHADASCYIPKITKRVNAPKVESN